MSIPASKVAAPEPGVVAAACNDRSPCDLVRRWEAGRDDAGARLEVVMIALAPDTEQGQDACIPHETHVAVTPATGSPVVTPVFVSCEMHGKITAPDEVKVSPNRLVIEHSPGGWASASQSSVAEVVRLSPLSLREHHERSWFRTHNDVSRSEWSSDSFSGGGGHFDDECPSPSIAKLLGAMPKEDTFLDWGKADAVADAYVAIPWVRLPASFGEGAWKTTSLGACAALVDATGEHGFVIHGKAGTSSDGRMRVVGAAHRTFLVEIEDDVVIAKAASRLFEDHLEVWLADHVACDAPPPAQVFVRSRDAAVSVERGTIGKDAVHAEVVRDGAKLRFRIDVEAHFDAITFVYSDSDDGRTQERLIATSRLRPAAAQSLGAVQPINPDDATCRIERDASGSASLVVDAPVPFGAPIE